MVKPEQPHGNSFHKISLVQTTVATILSSLAVIFLAGSQLGNYWHKQVLQPMNYQFRQAVGKAPKLDPKIKIYVFDDVTLHDMGAAVLPSSFWRM